MTTKEIQDILDRTYPNNLGFFVFGSKIYGTNSPTSDIDVIVLENSLNGQTKSLRNLDLHFLDLESFLSQLKECHPRAIECYFSPMQAIKTEIPAPPLLALRESFSQKSSHSFVKAKKKFIDKEFYIGKKSLFHSLRILEFGIQIAKSSKISDFSALNSEFFAIITHPNTPEALEELLIECKKKYNALHSEFKKLAPKSSL